MSTYVECYKCLVCQTLFSNRLRTVLHDEDKVGNALFNAAVATRTIPSQVHYCDDGNIGLALLAGFVLKLNEDDEL